MTNAEAIELDTMLNEFRANESPDAAIVLLGDDEAMRVLIAFQNAEHDWKRPRRAVPKTMASRWAWLVLGHDVDLEFISIAARVSDETAHTKLRMLFANRLVYPDGTITKAARTALNAHAAAKLGYKPAKRPAAAAATPAQPSHPPAGTTPVATALPGQGEKAK